MKKIVYILLVLSNSVFSQTIVTNQLFEHSDTSSMTLSFYGTGNYGSTIFNNAFVDIFRQGGFIDNSMKDAALSKSKRLNYFGGEASYGIVFSDPTHKLFRDWGYYGEISSNTSAGAQFTNGLYELAFYGNKGNAGDTLSLTQTGYHSRNFKKIAFGLDNNTLKIGVSYLSFGNYDQGLVQSGSFYTDSLGNSISMDINGSQFQSTSNLKQIGTGIAVDFEYRLSEKLFSTDSALTKESTMIIGIKNIGLYISRKNTTQTTVDTTYNYNGFEINSISNFGNSIISQQQLTDSIALNKEGTRIVGMLPFEMYFYKPALGLKKWESIYGFRYKILSNYRAFIYFGGNLHLKKGLNISSYLSYGGYSKLQFGFALNRRYNNLLFEINSTNLLGLLSKKQYGKAAGISIKYNFK